MLLVLVKLMYPLKFHVGALLAIIIWFFGVF
ncbi:hypothetical protein PPIS_a6000 [Pseudoalteromonas piscicida]|uniref:Uncharacterized protein n=1 Tax=Pseudoalteromonas piscicida TaxID=43662 RepID=A0ABM6NAF1_PSEO7|nr:hypothetical protein PPIS_a6000 [Pseudoalteromonas piscicida]